MDRRELQQAETVDVGFFYRPDNGTMQHPGRLVKDSDGRLWVVMNHRTSGNQEMSITVAGEQKGTLWLLSGESDHYLLMGVRGLAMGSRNSRLDLCGGYEMFTQQILSVDAAFRVSGGNTPYGDPDRQPPTPAEVKFDAFDVAVSDVGLWVGLVFPEEDTDAPRRLPRKQHERHETDVVVLSVGSECEGDVFWENLSHRDVVHVDCKAPQSLDSIHTMACVVHDFVNITYGGVVTATLVLYVAGGHDETRAWRRFELISQGDRFQPHKSPRWAPMLDLDDVGGLATLGKLLAWCGQHPVNSVILHRTVHSWDDWRDRLAEHWRTLNLIVGGEEKERVRITKLVDLVGKDVAMQICPEGVTFESWMKAMADHRNRVVAHPSACGVNDSRSLHEGRVFAEHMDFLLKAFVFKHGLGVNLARPKIVDGLKATVNRWSNWDWRRIGEPHPLY